jgi:hypothetical protein
MGDTETNYLHGAEVALCKFHYCAVLNERVDNTHNKLTCSGVVMQFGTDDYFNPITPYLLDLNLMKPMPTSSVNVLSTDIAYYYAKDIRTTFYNDILSVNCTNDLKTCITFNNSSMCFGNVDDVHLISSQQAVAWGAMTSLIVGAFVVFVVMPRISKWRGGTYMLFLYLVPLVGTIFIYFGVALSPKTPFVVGILIITWTFPLVYYSMRDIYWNDVKYIEIKNESPF